MIDKSTIIIAVLSMIKENGIKFTMTSLSKKLGISKRTLYTIYPSKESLFDMIIEDTFNDIKIQKQEILADSHKNDLEKLISILHIIPKNAFYSDFRRTYELKNAYPDLYDKVLNMIDTEVNEISPLLCSLYDNEIIRNLSLVLLQMNISSIYKSVIHGKLLIEKNIEYKDAIYEYMQLLISSCIS